MKHEQAHMTESGGMNPCRFSVENPHITWVLLIGTLLWGIYGFLHMPQRKDPDIPIKAALVVTNWRGTQSAVM